MTVSLLRPKFRYPLKKATHAIAAACFMATITTSDAQEVIFRQAADPKSGSYVEVTSLFSHPSLGGFHPVRVAITNNQKIPHSIFLSFTDSSDYQQSLSTTSDFSFYVKPGETGSYDILVPLSAQTGHTYSSYRALNATLSGSMGKTNQIENTPFTPEQPLVLLSDTLYSPNASALDSELNSRLSSSRGSGVVFSSRFSAKQLPNDWRAFSGFDSIMMTDDDWAETPAGARNAISAWLRLGGQLVIYSRDSPTPATLGMPDETSFGNILIRQITDDRLDPKETIDLAFSNSSKKTRIAAVGNDFQRSWPLRNILGEKAFNYFFFILILIAFGILVGPVNLFVFAKSGRRHRLFVTTPVISIATSLLLVVLIILQDGFGGEGARLVLMEVRPDENQNAAFIHQEQFSRTGVMTSPGFAIDSPAVIAPVPITESRWSRFTNDYDTEGTYDLQPTKGKLLAAGSWFQSRSEQAQLINAVVPTRGRIETTRNAEQLVSTFSFPIETLLYRDDAGNWFRADKITKGKAIELTAVDPTMVQPVLNDLTNKFSTRHQSLFKLIRKRKGHFVAFTTEGPAIETHPSIDWQTTTVITGPVVQ